MKRLSFALAALALVAGTGPAAQAQAPPAVASPIPAQPAAYRYGGISGLYTLPQGDFDGIAGEGWGILITGEQFLNPSMMVAITSDVGYLDFGSKSLGSTKTDISMFPVQAGLRIYPLMQKKPDSKAQLFGEGGLGFYYTRTEVQTLLGASSQYDYYFGTNAGAGVKLSANPKVSFLFDATWNWVFATGTDPNYLALRGALMIPIMR
jgi:hypothetical protein